MPPAGGELVLSLTQPDPTSNRSTGRGRRVPVALLAALAGLLLGVAPPLQAQGFGIYEQGTCVMGRGGAAAATPCLDGSSMFFNPAGLAEVDRITASAGVTGIRPFGSFTSDRTGEETDLVEKTIPVPHGYGAAPLGDRVTAGLGVYAPYGLETEWPADGEEAFDGRFLGYDNSLQTVYVQPTAAVHLTDRLSVGGGPLLALGRVELNQRLDLSSQPVPGTELTFGQLGVPFHTGFADANLDADWSTGFGANIGLRYEPTERISLGARYLTPVEIDYSGDATFEQVSTGLVLPDNNPLGLPGGTSVDALLQQEGVFDEGGPLADQGVQTSITMPGQLVVGAAVRPLPRLELEADWVYTQWAAFDTVRLEFGQQQTPDDVQVENYDDTHGVHAGLEYSATDRIDVRAGYFWNEPASPDAVVTPLLPEGERTQGTVGIGWEATPRLQFDVAYQFLYQLDRRGRTVDPPEGSAPTEDLNNGLYSFAAHLFAATATVRW